MVALGAGRRRARDASPVTSAHAARPRRALGRSNNRVLLSPSHHLAYCNVPKAASSTVTTYMTGLNAGINTFKGVEEYIQANGGDSHFAMTQYSTFEDAALASQLEPDGEKYKVFTVVRHPGTRLYSTWFDKIHAHRGSDQPDLLWYACNNDEECPFEKFVEGVTNQIADVGDTKQFINEHVEPQADICNPKKRDFDGVFRLEDGFGEIADTLRDWTGTAFDFQSGMAGGVLAPQLAVQGGVFGVSRVRRGGVRVAHALRRAAQDLRGVSPGLRPVRVQGAREAGHAA